MKMKAESRVMNPQVKERQGLSAKTGNQDVARDSLSAKCRKGTSPADTMTLNFLVSRMMRQ